MRKNNAHKRQRRILSLTVKDQWIFKNQNCLSDNNTECFGTLFFTARSETMQRIIKYKLDDDGTYSAVITGISLGNDETQLLDESYSIAVDVKVYDPYKITDKQRRKIFALVNDIEAHTGQPSEYMRGMFIHYLQALHGTENRISMAS